LDNSRQSRVEQRFERNTESRRTGLRSTTRCDEEPGGVVLKFVTMASGRRKSQTQITRSSRHAQRYAISQRSTGGEVFKGVAMKQITVILSILLLSSGCVVVGGYSSGRGWFVWPGTIVIFVVVALLFLVLRRRR